MSRVAKNPVVIPSGVDVTVKHQDITIKKGNDTLSHTVHNKVSVAHEDDLLKISANDNSISAKALSGTTRALLNNMVIGVNTGFEKKLQLVGVGYRAKAEGKNLNLTLGFSHPVDYPVPEGITIETPTQTEVVIKGVDKQQVGQVAAEIRAYRPPEPYKGKGVRYSDEHVVIKEAKKK